MPTLETNANMNGGTGTGAGPAAPTPPPLGTLIDDGTDAGALQLTTVLGYGGYGVVYRAAAPSGSLYAVKCLLRTSNPSNPKQQQRQRRLHLREIALHRLAGAGAHPGIVQLLRVIEPALAAADGSLSVPSPYTFLVMDFAPCGDLFTLILHKQVYLGRTGLVARVFAQLAAAVSHCHALGIFHRDLKPENVLCWDGGATVKLSDFGLATTERRSKEWRTGSVYHMSPECQNGNASSMPYSPRANDIWSLAILLLNLLTARNPWARASPSDPTFSAYLSSPKHFLPQVLPISNGLNDVLVRALDVQWERREEFGVDALADAVARLGVEPDENQSRRSGFAKFRSKVGLYAPDVVFEGGMARCPWEVGMHIPSGSSGESDGNNNHIRIPEELKPKNDRNHPQKPTKVNARSSSASFGAPLHESPTASMMVEAIPPPTPAKDVPRSRWSADSTRAVEVNEVIPVDNSQGSEFEFAPSANVVKKLMHADEETMSEIRFAKASKAGHSTPSSESSASSSEVSSLGSVYSRTPANRDFYAHDPRISESGMNVEAERYAYAIAAENESIEDKSRYVDVRGRSPGDITNNSPRRNTRLRGRSRGRQPYPQLNHRDRAAIARSRNRRPKPQLKLNVNLPSFLPFRTRGSSDGNGTSTERTGSPTPSLPDPYERSEPEPMSSSPFAYSVSHSGSSGEDPEMDVDPERRVLRNTDPDVHMISPSTVNDTEEDEDQSVFYTTRPRDSSGSFHESFGGNSLSATPGSLASPTAAIETEHEGAFVVQPSNHSPTDPSYRSSAEVDSNGRKIFRIDRSTLDSATTGTAAEFAIHGSEEDAYSGSGDSDSVVLHYPYKHDFTHSHSASPSSSLYRSNVALQSHAHAANGPEDDADRLTDSMDADMFEFGRNELLVSSTHSSASSRVQVAWVDELRRAVEDAGGIKERTDTVRLMDTDDYDALPSLPGSFPASPVEPTMAESRRQSRALRSSPSPGAANGTLGLDLFTHSNIPVRESRLNANSRQQSQVASSAYSGPPPSVRSQTNSADVALRELHAALESSPWTAPPDTSGWTRSVASQTSVTTRPSQTFMAITTDTNPHYSGGEDEVDGNEFREYAQFLRYAESPTQASPVAAEDRNAGKRFSARPDVMSASMPSFRAHQQEPQSFRYQRASTDPEPVSECAAESPSPRRSRSRTRSFLKFVSRRPFSSSGAGFVPRRAGTPSFLAETENDRNYKSDFAFGKGTPARFSFTISPEEGGQGQKAVNTRRDTDVKGAEALAATMAKLTSSSPTAVATVFALADKETALPPLDNRRSIVSLKHVFLQSEPAPHHSKHRPTTPPKSRTWSFTNHSHSHARRRSRSISPPPTRGSRHDVLFRLRSARNWFWSALSGFGSGSSFANRHATSNRNNGPRWGSPLVSVAV